jgi:hypothetical protein
MDTREGMLIKLDTGGYSDCDGNVGIIVKISRDFFVATDWLFKIFFFDKNEIRWYKRQNFEVLA